ncbi:hypothetical protein, partial [uncultured Pseudomonas sp.]|uniref:hypothetical protein n=1 Tax=uncultured Pseudomonas sp. TaxID=114707 RepID=UPI0025974FB0
ISGTVRLNHPPGLPGKLGATLLGPLRDPTRASPLATAIAVLLLLSHDLTEYPHTHWSIAPRPAPTLIYSHAKTSRRHSARF